MGSGPHHSELLSKSEYATAAEQGLDLGRWDGPILPPTPAETLDPGHPARRAYRAARERLQEANGEGDGIAIHALHPELCMMLNFHDRYESALARGEDPDEAAATAKACFTFLPYPDLLEQVAARYRTDYAEA